jgi:hypothetical protein
MEKVKDSFTKTIEKAIIKLHEEERSEKFNQFMLAFFACAFLCVCFFAIIYL